jgi:integrase
MRSRYQRGSVQKDERRGVWTYRYRDGNKRPRITLGAFKTRAAAEREADKYRGHLNADKPQSLTFAAAAYKYMASDRFPTNPISAECYRHNLENYAIPNWGDTPLLDWDALAVEKWFKTLVGVKGEPLANKSKAPIKAVMRSVYEYAMAAKLMPIQRNPVSLVQIKGASKRAKEPTILSRDECIAMVRHIVAEPARTAVIVSLRLMLRESEVAGLKWEDIDWARQEVNIRRNVLRNHIGTCKRDASRARLVLDEELTEVLKAWRKLSEFTKETDWVFASPYSAGEMPYCMPNMMRRTIKPAMRAVGITGAAWHAFRHSVKSWLNEAGVPLGVQKDMLRHSDISTTANIYGHTLSPAMREAQSKIGKIVQ